MHGLSGWGWFVGLVVGFYWVDCGACCWCFCLGVLLSVCLFYFCIGYLAVLVACLECC